MPSSLHKVQSSDRAVSIESYDNDGTPELRINGIKVLTSQQTTIADPAGGATIDAEARTAINAIIDALQAHGLIA